MRRRILGIVRKEFIHIFRDMRSLLIVVLMPILMIVLYGYGITLDIKNIEFAVIDDANTPESRALRSAFAANGFFHEKPFTIDRRNPEPSFMRRDIQLLVVIPGTFSVDLLKRNSASLQLIIDAADPNVAQFVGNYSAAVIADFEKELNGGLRAPMRIEPRLLYNPDLKSAFFFVPGLVALILMLINALLTSITVTREKETGTLEQILVSPIRPFEILIGKVAPYIVLGFANATMILVFSYILFGVPIHGNAVLLAGMILVYIFTALSFGLLISTVAKTQQIAMFMTLMATILPTIMLSGFIFPIASMPAALQYISKALPATYFLVIIRGIMLKGVGLSELLTQSAILSGIGLLLMAITAKRFKMKL